MNDTFTVLAVGDVVGQEATGWLSRRLMQFRQKYGADMVIVNAENASEGNGLDKASAMELLAAGADVLTSGNHIWQKKDIKDLLDDSPDILRPANYRPELPGRGYGIYEREGMNVLVMNVMGTVFMEPLGDPFATCDRILEKEKGKYDIAILDIHAEATSEKIALAYYLDGRASVVFGTHTHVQTADHRVFPNGTGYLTDLGMTGPMDSVLGVKTACILEKLRYHIPVRFETAKGNIEMHGAVFVIDRNTGKTIRTEIVSEK